MEPVLLDWLKQQFKISNIPKYQKYLDSWLQNLTKDQIKGFEKMRTADYIKH